MLTQVTQVAIYLEVYRHNISTLRAHTKKENHSPSIYLHIIEFTAYGHSYTRKLMPQRRKVTKKPLSTRYLLW